MAKHKRMERGSYRWHPQETKDCPTCRKPRAAKLYLDDEGQLLSISRVSRCARRVVDFSIGVQTYHKTRTKFVYVVRACTAHANYHWHWWHFLRVNEIEVEPKRLLDTQDDLNAAYTDASHNVIPRALEWRDLWARRK